MAAELSGITASAPVSGMDSLYRGSAVRVPDGQAGPAIVSQDPMAGERNARLSIDVANLGVAKDALASIAVDVRDRAQSLQQLGVVAADAAAPLLETRKFFPPLPIGSAQRNEYLQQYSGFRKLIENVTLTPIDISWPKQFQDSGQMVNQPGSGEAVIQADAGTAELPAQVKLVGGFQLPDLPQLDSGSSDAAVQAAIEQLGQLSAGLDQARQDLLQGFAAVVQSVNQGTGDPAPLGVGNAADVAQSAAGQLGSSAVASISSLVGAEGPVRRVIA